MIESDELYPKELDQRKITYISNLDPEDENEEEQLKAIKEEELQKWSEIVQLIHKCKSENPADMEDLLKKLMRQS